MIHLRKKGSVTELAGLCKYLHWLQNTHIKNNYGYGNCLLSNKKLGTQFLRYLSHTFFMLAGCEIRLDVIITLLTSAGTVRYIRVRFPGTSDVCRPGQDLAITD